MALVDILGCADILIFGGAPFLRADEVVIIVLNFCAYDGMKMKAYLEDWLAFLLVFGVTLFLLDGFTLCFEGLRALLLNDSLAFFLETLLAFLHVSSLTVLLCDSLTFLKRNMGNIFIVLKKMETMCCCQ